LFGVENDDGDTVISRRPIAKSGAALAAPAASAARTQTQNATTPGAPAPPTNQVAEGLYQHGRGQYSDSAEGMGFGLRFSGQPNAQNMRAADNLAQQQQGQAPARIAAAQAAAPYAGGLPEPQIRHAGNDWASANELRNARVSASSIRNTERWGGKGASQNNPALQRYEALLQADAQARAGQTPLAQDGLRQGGETRRAHMAAQLAGQRLNLDAQKLGLERQLSGFGLRSNAVRQRLMQQAATAKDPPGEAGRCGLDGAVVWQPGKGRAKPGPALYPPGRWQERRPANEPARGVARHLV